MVLLIQFYNDQDWIQFRALELQSLLELHHIQIDSQIEVTSSMLFILDIEYMEEVIQQICQRSVLIKSIYELIASHPNNIEELVKQVFQSTYWQSIQFEYLNKSWNLQVHSLNKTLSHEEKEQFRQLFTKELPLTGEIDLQSPQQEFHLIMEYPFNSSSEISKSSHSIPMYFGKLLSRGGMREVRTIFE